MNAAALPTRRDEDWRYADLAAAARAWPPRREVLVLADGAAAARSLVIEGDGDVLHELDIELGAGAQFDLHLANCARGSARVAITARLGEGARFHLGAAQVGLGEARLELVTTVVHLGRDAVSYQQVRSVAGGRAVVNCLGKVVVQPGADGTDAGQSLRAMLLSPGAVANARPELEIYADDVKCAHGCAIGELDANALFYMAARGLPPAEARRLMLRAFLAEAIAGAEDEEALTARVVAALEAAE